MADIITSPARLSLATLDAYLAKKKIEPIVRSSVLLSGLEAHGRHTKNCGGKTFKWFPRFRRHTLTPGPGAPNTRNFPRINLRKEASLPYRSYWMGESILKFEKLAQQKGGSDVQTVLWNIAQDLVDIMMDDAREDFREELYVDGYATGNEQRIHGFESWMGNTGSSLTNVPVADPSDTYGGLSTVLGYYGGSWSALSGYAWPTGTGSPEYCFWSPLIIDYQNHWLGGATHTWSVQWQTALNYAATYGETIQDLTYEVCILHPELYRQARDSLKSLQTVEVTQYQTVTKLGFPTLNYMGLELTREYGVPEASGYLFRWRDLELRNMQGQLFVTDKDSDITTGSQLLALDFYGNLVCYSPAWTAKLEPTTTGT